MNYRIIRRRVRGGLVVAGLLAYATAGGGSLASSQTMRGRSVGTAGFPHLVAAAAPDPKGGYWDAFSDGTVQAANGAAFYGDMRSASLNAPIVGLAPPETPASIGGIR